MLGGIALVDAAYRLELHLVIPRQELHPNLTALLEARDHLKEVLGDVSAPGTIPMRTEGLHFSRPSGMR